MKRKIIHIHEEKCNGCELCINACHEGALQLVNGKAKLISDIYCDGLGDCLPVCPTDAIEIIEREANEYSQEAVDKLLEEKSKKEDKMPCGCPGTMSKKINKEEKKETETFQMPSYLSQWPVQLKLVHPRAEYFKNANLLIAADCTAYAYGNFHKDFIKNHVTLIGCPKLDDNEYYREKITEILSNNDIKSITVIRMEVPCCGGIVSAVRGAILDAQKIVPYKEVTVGINGELK